MWPDKASLNIQTHGQYHALKTQRIGSEKTYGPKIKAFFGIFVSRPNEAVWVWVGGGGVGMLEISTSM